MRKGRLICLGLAMFVLAATVTGGPKKQGPKVPVIFYAVYVFHAKSDGEMLGYQWPLDYTAVMVLDRMVRNTAELVESLRGTYRFGYYGLVRAYSLMEVFREKAGGEIVGRTYGSPGAGEAIEIGGKKLDVWVRSSGMPTSEEGPIVLNLRAVLPEERKTVFTASVATRPGKTVVVGDRFPPGPWIGDVPKEAIFVAVTPVVEILEDSNELNKAAEWIKTMRNLAPETDERIPLAEDGFWAVLLDEVATAFGSRPKGFEPSGNVPGRESVTTLGVAHFRSPEAMETYKEKMGRAIRESRAQWDTSQYRVTLGKQVVVAFDKGPRPVGGLEALQKQLRYPETALRDSVSGTVLVRVTIDEQGKVTKWKIVKSLRADCDSAALAAIRGVKWEPAYLEDKPVEVSVIVPVMFELGGKKEAVPIFTAYDFPPEPIGGFEAIQKQIAGSGCSVSGRVIVHVLVNERGDVEDVRILKGLEQEECNEAAIRAVKSVKWKPALQRDKPVSVWVAIPVIFKAK